MPILEKQLEAMVDAAEIAEAWGCKVNTVRRAYRTGRIPGVKLSGHVLRFRPSAVEKALARLEESGPNSKLKPAA